MHETSFVLLRAILANQVQMLSALSRLLENAGHKESAYAAIEQATLAQAISDKISERTAKNA